MARKCKNYAKYKQEKKTHTQNLARDVGGASNNFGKNMENEQFWATGAKRSIWMDRKSCRRICESIHCCRQIVIQLSENSQISKHNSWRNNAGAAGVEICLIESSSNDGRNQLQFQSASWPTN